MNNIPQSTRRQFLTKTATAAAGTSILLTGCQNMAASKEAGEEEEKVTPGEDLMQEHGILKRLLLVYGEAIRRMNANQDLPPEPIEKAAKLVRSFVEEYHEQQE